MRELTGQQAPSAPSDPHGKDESGTRVIPVIQEEASVSRVAEETGASVRVRIASHEEKERIPATDIIEETSVERVPINRFVTERTPPREEGDVVIVPVFETVAVVEMRLLLKEEVRIIRRKREVTREEEVVLRKETPIIERKDSDQGEYFLSKETDMTQTVIGVFDTPDAAQAAEQRLVSRGIDESALHIAAQEAAYGESDEDLRARHQQKTGGIRNFFSELFGTQHSEEVGHYSEAVRRGGVILAVDVPDGAPLDPVREALLDAGAVDIDERVEQWRQQGYSGYNPEARPYSADEVARERSTVLPVIREDIEVGKREVAKGTVRIVSRTVETPVRETVNLREEHATIERRPADRPVSQADMQNLGDKTVEVREMAEKSVVNKSARVVEEVEIGKEVTQRAETIEDTVRHTEVNVARGETDNATAAYQRPYEDYEPDYRKDFQTRYGAQGGTYDDYAPAYRYGHTLAGDPRYQGRDWSAIEPEARRDWESHYPESTWERFKLAVQHGWERVTGRH